MEVNVVDFRSGVMVTEISLIDEASRSSYFRRGMMKSVDTVMGSTLHIVCPVFNTKPHKIDIF